MRFLGCGFLILHSCPLLLGVDFFDMIIESFFGLEKGIAVGILTLMPPSLLVVVAILAVAIVVGDVHSVDIAFVEVHLWCGDTKL